MNLTRQTLDAQIRLKRLLARDAALLALTKIIDPAGELSTSALADEIARLLRRFSGTPWQRIRDGRRVAQNDIERALVALTEADTPTSARRVFPLLRDLFGD